MDRGYKQQEFCMSLSLLLPWCHPGDPFACRPWEGTSLTVRRFPFLGGREKAVGVLLVSSFHGEPKFVR